MASSPYRLMIARAAARTLRSGITARTILHACRRCRAAPGRPRSAPAPGLDRPAWSHRRRRSLTRRRVGLPRAIYDLESVPHLDARMAAGGEQLVCSGLRFRVGVAIAHVRCCDTISGIQVVKAINRHSHKAHGVAALRRSLAWGKSNQFGESPMHLLPLRRRLRLQPLDRVQDPVPRLGAGHVALV